MATVEQVTAKYSNILLPILPTGEGVCAICKTAILPGWTLCYQCNTHRAVLDRPTRVVAPVALAVKGGQWAYELSAYKNSPSPSVRRQLAIRLSAVLWRWLDDHEECLEVAARVDEFSLVTSVPSTGGRRDHPLPRMLREFVEPVADRYVDLLKANLAYDLGSREPSDDRFAVPQQLHGKLRGEPVLLIDDQWTSGGRMQSAVSALRAAGASRVAVVALGRHFDRRPAREDYREAAERYYQASKAQKWSWSTCCVCE